MLGKYRHLRDAYARVRSATQDPFSVAFERILSPTTAMLGGKECLLLGTNNYLGLTKETACIEAAVSALREHGTGTTGSRIANGTYGEHEALERQIARFLGRRSAMVFSTGYQANLGTLSALASRDDHLLLDADSHASIHDGARLSGAKVTRFRHNDAEDLRRRLRLLKEQPGEKLIVTEGIYSMLGDTAPLRDIVEVKKEFGAHLLVDEAHSLGVLGANGRGLAEQAGVEADVDFVVGTFSKSLGGIGGFCASDIPDFDLLRLTARAYMFTASLSPAIVAGVSAALDQVGRRPELRESLRRNGAHLYRGLAGAGFAVGPEASPIVSVALPDAGKAVAFWNALLERQIYVNLALPPATPNGASLLRMSVSAAHSTLQIENALAVICDVGRTLGVIGSERRLAVA